MAGRGGTEETEGALHGVLPRPTPPSINWLSARLDLGTCLLCSEGSLGAGQLMGGVVVLAWVGGACWARAGTGEPQWQLLHFLLTPMWIILSLVLFSCLGFRKMSCMSAAASTPMRLP